MSKLEVGKCYIIREATQGVSSEDLGKPAKVHAVKGCYCILHKVDGFSYETKYLKMDYKCAVVSTMLSCFGHNPVEYIPEPNKENSIKTVCRGVEVTHGDEVFRIAVDQTCFELEARYVDYDSGDGILFPIEVLDDVIEQLQKLRDEVL